MSPGKWFLILLKAINVIVSIIEVEEVEEAEENLPGKDEDEDCSGIMEDCSGICWEERSSV